jgi:hypothetical protein
MIIDIYFFQISGYLKHPQFDDFSNFTQLQSIAYNEKPIFYIGFFVLDFIWAFFGITYLIRQLIEWHINDVENNFSDSGLGKNVFLVFILSGLLAYLFDAFENVAYIIPGISFVSSLSTVFSLKLIFYALFLSIFFYHLFRIKIYDHLRVIGKFIVAGSLSLCAVIIVSLLLTQMDQGGTIVVDLINKPWNLISSFILIFFLSILLSHYPLYIESIIDSNLGREWMKKDCILFKRNFFLFDIIYFKGFTRKANLLLRILREYLGAFVFLAFFYVILFSANNYYQLHLPVFTICLILTITYLVFYTYWANKRIKWIDDIAKTIGDLKSLAIWFIPLILLFTVSLISIFFVSYFYQWQRVTILLTLFSLLTGLSVYCIFTVCRSYLKYFYFSHNLYDKREIIFPGVYRKLEEREQQQKKFTIYQSRWIRIFPQKKWSFLGYLSDNIVYLKVIKVFTSFVFISLLFLNVFIDLSVHFNPLIIILLYIIFFYSTLVYFLKQIIYYKKSKQPAAQKAHHLLKYGFAYLLILIFVWSVIATNIGNKLHHVPLVKESDKDLLSIEDYVHELDLRLHREGKGTNLFYVASYGGGLKANLWNMLIINDLQKRTQGRFFERTAVFSTVSGGTIGVGDYMALRYTSNHKNQNNEYNNSFIEDGIYRIGKHNFLSVDITMAFGRDLFRELVPEVSFNGNNRARVAMRRYAELCGLDECQRILGFRTFWNESYSIGHIPALVINTTATTGQQGILCSLTGSNLNSIFSGSLDVLDLEKKNKAPIFFDALSFSNRFPIFSPTARISEKGHFVDAGYFDNSGLISASNFQKYVFKRISADSLSLSQESNIFINIINGRDLYIQSKLDEWCIHLKNSKQANELGAVISTVISIDKIPKYISNRIKDDGFVLIELHMPHVFTYDDAVNVLGGEPEDPFRLDQLIIENDSIIKEVLKKAPDYNHEKWGIIQPPLARLLSLPAVEYERAMVLYHPEVKNNIDSICGYLNNSFNIQIPKHLLWSIPLNEINRNPNKVQNKGY